MKQALERLRHVSALIDVLDNANAKLDLQTGLIVASLEGEILYMSPGACQIFEHGSKLGTGENLEMLMPERYRAGHREGLRRIAAGETSRLVGRNLSLVGLRRDGKEIPIILKVEVRDGGELGPLLTGRVYVHPDVDRSILLAVEGTRGGR
jgi:PAS domain S-box-containing protein